MEKLLAMASLHRTDGSWTCTWVIAGAGSVAVVQCSGLRTVCSPMMPAVGCSSLFVMLCDRVQYVALIQNDALDVGMGITS